MVAHRKRRALFLGRSDEQNRFRTVLDGVVHGGEPDEAFVVLVSGLGGIGKSTLLRRYREMATGVRAGRLRPKQGLLLAAVDWESEQRRRAADYSSEGGPPIWVVLDRIYDAIHSSGAEIRGGARAVEKAFSSFRLQVTRVPELAEEVRQALPGGESRAHLSPADIEAVLQAVGRGAAVAHPAAALVAEPIAKGVGGAVHLAQDAREAVREQRRGRVPEEAYRLILRRVEALVDTFADGLRLVTSKVRPVVVILDTCELILGSQEYLRRAMSGSGSHAAWVIGMRLEPEATGEGEAALYRRTIAESRLRSVPLARFPDQLVAEFLDLELPGGLPSGTSVENVAEVTRGIPLAVSLVCDLLAAGQDPEVVLRPVPEPGKPSAVIRELAERYLTHAVHCPPLQRDLPLLYGLALVYRDRLDPGLLAALWGVDPTKVADLTAGLAAHHDFVLRGSRRLHDDVRDTIRLYLLDDALRAQQRPMNRRAEAHLHHRLGELGLTSVDDQLTSDEWQNLTTALLWHVFWEDNRSGIELLCQLLPAADILDESFAAALLAVASFFIPVLDAQQKQAIVTLRALRAARIRWWILELGRPSSGRALEVLEHHRYSNDAVLATDIPRSAYLHLLRAKHAERSANQAVHALTELEQADRAIPDTGDPPGATSRVLAHLAEQLFRDLIDVEEGAVPPFAEARRAASLAARSNPSPSAWVSVGMAHGALGRYAEALHAYDQATRLDPEYAPAYSSRGNALLSMGLFADALHAYDDAIRIRPKQEMSYNKRQKTVLGLLGWSRSEAGPGIHGEGSSPSPLDPGWPAGRAKALLLLGRFKDAQDAYDEIIRLDPHDADAYCSRGECLLMQRRYAEAITNLRQAIELQPDAAFAARVLLAALIRRDEPIKSAELASTVDASSANYLSPFRRGELQALAFLLVGDPDAAATELHAVKATRSAVDLFQQPLYELLEDPPAPGIDRLIAIWAEIDPGTQHAQPEPSRESQDIEKEPHREPSSGRERD